MPTVHYVGLPPCFSIIFEMFCTLRVFQVLQSGDYCICILLYMMLLQQRSAVRVKTYGNSHFPNFPEQEWPDMLSLSVPERSESGTEVAKMAIREATV